MTKYLTLLLLTFSLSGYSQERFYKNIPGWIATSVIKNENNFYVFGLSQDSLFNHRIQITNISVNGDIINQLEYFIDSCIYTSLQINSIFDDNNFSYIAGLVLDMDSLANEYKPLGALYKFNKSLNQIDTVQFFPKIGNNFIFYCMDKCDPYYYFAGAEKPADSVFSFVCKTDTLGNIKWKRRFRYEFPYYFGNAITKPSQIVRMTGEKHIVTFDSYTSDLYINKQYMACIDSSGNLLWEKNVKPELETYQCFLAITPLQNDEFVIAWCDPKYKTAQYPYAQRNPNATIWAAKMDANGNYLWEKNYSNHFLSSDTLYVQNRAIETDLNGNILVGLQYRSWRSKPGLMNLRPNGSVKWIRYYDLYPENFGDIEYTDIYDILPLGEDGYYMACEFVSTPGNTFPNGIQTGLVIKTDQYGCLEPGCQWNDPTIDEPDEYHGSETTGIACPGDEENLHIWPNPVHENLFVETLVLPAVIKMYNLKGELVKQISINEKLTAISTGKLPKGIYWLQVIGNHGMKTGKVVVE